MKLLVLVPEKISQWIDKGEVIDRYYNPGGLFDEVHICICTADDPDRASLQRLVGSAALFVKCFKFSRVHMLLTLGLQPLLLRLWSRKVVRYAQGVNPSLVRCHGSLQNAFAAKQIKRKLGIPYVVSLHTNPDVDLRNRKGPLVNRIFNRLIRRVEGVSLRGADLVLPVYEPIVPYLETLGVSNVKVHYNMINSKIKRKTNWHTSTPPRLISVGRVFELKYPIEIVRAMAHIPNAVLTIVGDGPLHHSLVNEVDLLRLSGRVDFIRAATNDEVCDLLQKSDVFVTHSEHWEISKSVLEALLTGLPIILNRREGPATPELGSDLVQYVDNSAEAFSFAVNELLSDNQRRATQGRHALEVSWKRWSPSVTEEAFVSTYKQILESRASQQSSSGADRGSFIRPNY